MLRREQWWPWRGFVKVIRILFCFPDVIWKAGRTRKQGERSGEEILCYSGFWNFSIVIKQVSNWEASLNRENFTQHWGTPSEMVMWYYIARQSVFLCRLHCLSSYLVFLKVGTYVHSHYYSHHSHSESMCLDMGWLVQAWPLIWVKLIKVISKIFGSEARIESQKLSTV